MIYLHEIALNSGDTWDANLYKLATIDATGNVTITAEMDTPGIAALIFTQDATGSRTLTVNGTAVTVATTGTTIVDVVRHSGGWSFRGTASAPGTENITPDAPTLTADDTANTLAASHALGTSEIVVSENGGAYAAYAGQINVGDVARAAGYWKFKIKAATGRNESAVVDSPAFTVAGAAALYSNNFDGTANSTIPQGWVATDMIASSVAAAYSAPMVLTAPAASTLGTAFYNTVVPGASSVKTKFRLGGNDMGEMAIIVRSSLASYTGNNAYVLDLIVNNITAQGNGLLFLKRTNGTNATTFGETRLGQGQGTVFAVDTWYNIEVLVSGTTTVTLSAKVKRMTDGQWLNSSGAWQAGETTAVTVTDNSNPISADGYNGVLFYGASANYFDDFEIN